MKNGEGLGGSAVDEQGSTGFGDGFPPFGGGDIDIRLDSDAELNDDGNIDNSEIQQMLERDDQVQFEDSNALIDVPINESEGSKPEISEEDFNVAKSKLQVAWKRWRNLYYGEADPFSGQFSLSNAYRTELDSKLGRSGYIFSRLNTIYYEDFIAEGHTLEDISEEEKKFAEMADAIEAIDMSDFKEPSSEAGEPSDGEEPEKAKETAFAELSSARDALRDAILDAGFGESNGHGGIKTNDDLLEAKLKEIGEFDAFNIALDSWAEINSDRASATVESMTRTKDELDRFTELLKNLKADSAGDASNSEDYQEKFEQFRPEYIKAVNVFNGAIEWLGYVDSVNGTISNDGLDYFRSIGEYDNYTKMVKQALDYINKRSDPSEWPGMLEELKRIAKVLNDGEGAKNVEGQEKKAEAIDKLINTRDTKRISLLLEKISLDNTRSLDEAEPILNSLNLAELERIQKEIDDEINGEGDKNHEANGENLEYLRSLNFGQWLAVKYDVPGPDSKYFNPNFFAADRKLQQQVMQEYMALFEADANYEKDRVFMVEELCKVELAKKTMKEMGLDLAETNLSDLESMLNKMKIEELNKLYQKVFYSPKPASKPSSKTTDPKPAEPKPADVEPGNDGSDDDSGNPDADPSVDSSWGDDSSEDGDANADKNIAEKIKGIDKKMPATAEDVKAAFAASPDARRIYGEPDDKTVSKTLEEIKVWKKLSDTQKANFLQNGVVLNYDDLIALMELQKKGILPKRGA